MQVGEIRPATVEDFKQLLDIVFNHNESEWEEKPYKGGVKVWTKSIAASPVKMIKLSVDFDDIAAVTLYDVLHDPHFRRVWDDSMIEGLDIYKIDDYNDIGYYSLRCPPPLKNRDFVNQRSWGIFGDDHMIMNHTIDIEEMPVKKDFVRGVSYLTGYVIRSKEEGCAVHYITQNDPGGQVPKWILNRISSVIAPKVLEKIHKAALTYEEWKSTNRPEWRPWRGIGHDDKPVWPRLPSNSCRASSSDPSLELRKQENSHDAASSVVPNGSVVEGEKAAVQYGSLNSLAQQRTETPVPLSPKPEEIMGNVFNVPDTVAGDDIPVKPPFLRHESITIRYEEEKAATPPLTNGSKTPRQTSRGAMLASGKSFDSSRGEEQSRGAQTRDDTCSSSLMARMDSLDTTAGSDISELCHSLALLTKGEERPLPKITPARDGSFASVTMTPHPIDPDCCTRVSRHALAVYGVRSSSPSRLSPRQATRMRYSTPKPQVDTIPEKSEYKVKKSALEPEGLESSSLKFFSKISKGNKQRHPRRKQRDKQPSNVK